MATLKDIAAEAGVSIMTVSNVINGKFSRVSPKTVEIIREIAERYHYAPNLAARSLSSKSSKIIALFMPSGDYNNPHNVEAFNSIAHTISSHGYYLMVFSNNSPLVNSSNLHTWNVEGAICFAPLNSEDHDFFGQVKIPTCFIDSYHDSSKLLKVGIDDYRGGYLAGKYLADWGHTSVGFASYHTSFDKILEYRLEGFRQALKDSGVSLKEEHIFAEDTTYEGGIRVANRIADAKTGITAIFATEDEMAIGIMSGARQNGMNVPEQLSVIGFDNVPACEYVTPKLTTISQDITTKGHRAAELLIQLIETGEIKENNIKIPVRIVERQSVCKRI